MLPRLYPLLSMLLTVTSVACSVVSAPVKKDALSGLAFPELLANADRYRGETVILGGYILETENRSSTTLIRLLQVPLKWGDEPAAREESRGRFEVVYSGFLDPELYEKGRRLTVAGKVAGVRMRTVGEKRVPHLQLHAVEIHLWRQEPAGYAYPYYYDPWYPGYPWYWDDSPYYWHRPYPPRHPHRPRPDPRPDPRPLHRRPVPDPHLPAN